MVDSILKRAQDVLKIESEAVKDQIRHIDRDFAKVVQILHEITKCGGQVVVMGIGKSGLIGRKISATLSSTGTPAIFFHPAEGLHGDLGMIRSNDAVLVLSSSGETEEIRKILPVLKERGLVLIAMTSEKRSRLARSADFVIGCSVRREACPLNLAPTASTTAMLALGDALAMSLMERKGFKPSDFAKLHPGGALGKKLSLKIRDLMRRGDENPIVKVHSTVREALLEMTRTRLGATNVVDNNGRLVGFFTDGDLRRKLQEAKHSRSAAALERSERCPLGQKDSDILNRRIETVMTKKPTVITPEKSLNEALNLLKMHGFDNLPVVNEKGKSVGILDERDLLAEGIS